MVYSKGTVSVTTGSATVTGSSITEWLRNVTPGSVFKITGESTFYNVISIPTNNQILISPAYSGSTQSGVGYNIFLDRTPNMGLPLLSPNNFDNVDVLNKALLTLDRQYSSSVDFQYVQPSWGSPSGAVEQPIPAPISAFSIYDSELFSNELAIGRLIRTIHYSNGLPFHYGTVKTNHVFKAYVNGAPTGNTINYISGESVGYGSWLTNGTIIYNETKGNKRVVVSFSGTTTGTITTSGSIGPSTTWGNGDVLYCYNMIAYHVRYPSQPMGCWAFLSGDASGGIDTTSFKVKAGCSWGWGGASSRKIYNFNKQDYRIFVSRSGSISQALLCASGGTILTLPSIDTWENNDFVYMFSGWLQADWAMFDWDNDLTVEYGAKVTIGDDAVKENSIDWGHGLSQVNATKVPLSSTKYVGSGTDVAMALDHIYTLWDNHKKVTSGAHSGQHIAFADVASVGPNLTSTDVSAAIRELKGRVNTGMILQGTMDECTGSGQVKCYNFASYQNHFFQYYNWYMRVDYGANQGQVRLVTGFSGGAASGTFWTNPFDNAHSQYDKFSLMNLAPSGTTVNVAVGNTIVSGAVTINNYSGAIINSGAASGGMSSWRKYHVADASDVTSQTVVIPGSKTYTIGADKLDVYVDGVLQFKSGDSATWAYRESASNAVTFTGLELGMEIIFRGFE